MLLSRSLLSQSRLSYSLLSRSTLAHSLLGGPVYSTTYDYTTPTTVVSSAYTTSASARPQRLSNGWIVCAVYNGSNTILIYKSIDNGSTWSLLCQTSTWVASGGFAITSFGVNVYLLSINTSFTYNAFWKFDATTVSGTINQTANIDTSQSSFGSGCSIAVDSNGNLTASWASKNATYPNSFNIRSAKSTDSGTTWTKQDGTAGVDQITLQNSAGNDSISPCVAYDQQGYVHILAAYGGSVILHLTNRFTTKSGLTNVAADWGSNFTYNGSGYIQSSPSATVQKYGTNAGRIWVAWYGLDSTDNIYNDVRVSYSDDNGVTWSAMQKLTSGNAYGQYYPSLSTNTEGKVFVLFIGFDSLVTDSYQNIRKIIFDGSSWGSVQTITNNTTSSAAYPSTCDNYYNFEQPLTIWQDNQASAVKFYGKFTV
jgi:hypothetical protein